MTEPACQYTECELLVNDVVEFSKKAVTEVGEYTSPVQLVKQESSTAYIFDVDTTERVPVTSSLQVECEYGIVGDADSTKAGKIQTPLFEIEIEDTVCLLDSMTLSLNQE